MRLFSPAWLNGDALPLRFAAGWRDLAGRLSPGANPSPPLCWRDPPLGCRSLALLCHDFDATAHAQSLHAEAALAPTLATEPARGDLFHWVPGRPAARWPNRWA